MDRLEKKNARCRRMPGAARVLIGSLLERSSSAAPRHPSREGENGGREKRDSWGFDE